MNKDKLNELFESNKPLVSFVIKRCGYYPFKSGIEHDDILQNGYEGLWKACLTYDDTKGIRFSTYATICIQRNIVALFRSTSDIILDKAISLYSKIASTPDDCELMVIDSVGMNDDNYRMIEIIEKFNELLSIMNDKDKIFIYKFMKNNCSYGDTSKDLGISRQAVYSKMSRLKRLAKDENLEY